MLKEFWADEKIREYIKIWGWLFALTILEVLAVYIPNKTFSSVTICVFSIGKAVLVALYYMHLNHETKWLKFVAALPVIAFMYAVVLTPEATVRPKTEYLPSYPKEAPAADSHAKPPSGEKSGQHAPQGS